MHLCDVDFCGSLWNLDNSVIAQASKGMLKHTRHNLATCIITSTHSAFVHDLVRPQVVITANTLKRGGKKKKKEILIVMVGA